MEPQRVDGAPGPDFEVPVSTRDMGAEFMMPVEILVGGGCQACRWRLMMPEGAQWPKCPGCGEQAGPWRMRVGSILEVPEAERDPMRQAQHAASIGYLAIRCGELNAAGFLSRQRQLGTPPAAPEPFDFLPTLSAPSPVSCRLCRNGADHERVFVAPWGNVLLCEGHWADLDSPASKEVVRSIRESCRYGDVHDERLVPGEPTKRLMRDEGVRR